MKYLTTAEAAKRLDLDPSSVRRLIRDGHLPAVRHGRDWLIAESALAAARRRPTQGRPPKSSEEG